jgi:hypothetical protein
MSKESAKRIKKPSPGTVQIPQPGAEEAKLKALGGSCSDDFNTVVGCQVLNALSLDADPEAQQRQFAAAGAALIGIKPADEVEGMLAAQMVATHNAAMVLLQRLRRVETNRQQDSAGNLATKLLRTYAMQVEALQRYRGKGQQKVTVEHVHVHSGGQPIVGAVHQGGGVARESKEQPHAPGAIIHEPGIPMRSAD